MTRDTQRSDPASSKRPISSEEIGTAPTWHQHAVGAALVIDIAQFTRLTSRYGAQGPAGTEALAEHLDHYFGSMIHLLSNTNGIVVSIVGDSLLCIWTAEHDEDEVLLTAVNCGLAIQTQFGPFLSWKGVSLTQRVSVASGSLLEYRVGGVAGTWHSLMGGSAVVEAFGHNDRGDSSGVVAPTRLAGKLRNARVARRVSAEFSLFVANDPDRPHTPDPLLSARTLATTPIDADGIHRTLPSDNRKLLAPGEFRFVTIVFIGALGAEPSDAGPLALIHSHVVLSQQSHDRHGGCIVRLACDDKGVSILCAFGLPGFTTPRNAVSAVRFALDLHRAALSDSRTLALGVSSGWVYCSLPNTPHHGLSTIVGECVNVAARLMATGAPGVRCDNATKSATEHEFYFDQVGFVLAKGLSRPVETWSPRGHHSAPRRASSARLVGRENEVSKLRGLVDRCLCGSSASVIVCGASGIGKTSLMKDIASYAMEVGLRVVLVAASAFDSGTPYRSLRPLVRELLCKGDTFDPAEARSEAVRLLGHDDIALSWLTLLSDIEPRFGDESDLVREMIGRARVSGLKKVLSLLLKSLADQQPILVIAEDLHWFDLQSQAILWHVTSEIPSRLALFGTSRDLAPPVQEGVSPNPLGVETILLGPLDGAGLRVLLTDRLGASSVDERLVEFLCVASQGNPFFADQVITSLDVKAPGTSDTDQVGEPRQPLSLGVASQIGNGGWRDLVLSRVDALSQLERLALRFGAVVGGEFEKRMILELLCKFEDFEHANRCFSRLLQVGLFSQGRGGSDVFDLSHALLRDVVYDQLAFSTRREIHALIASWMYENEGRDFEARHSELARHWENAGDWERSVFHLEAAAKISSMRCASRDAILQAQRALKISAEQMLPSDPLRDARCLAVLGDAHIEIFQYQAGKSHFRRALSVLRSSAPRSIVSLSLSLSREIAQQACHRLFGVSSKPVDSSVVLKARVFQKLGEVLYFDGSRWGVLHATLTSLNLAERSGSVRESVGGLAALAIGFQSVGVRSLSEWYNRKAVELAEERGGIGDIAYANLVDGVYQAANGCWQLAIAALESASANYLRLGAGERWQQARAGLCAVALAQGRFEEGREILTSMIEGSQEAPAQISAYWLGFSASLSLAQGGPLETIVARLREVIRADDLAKVDRMFCQGLVAIACWTIGDRMASLAFARAGLDILDSGQPAAWYVTDGIAGIALTLIEASSLGLATTREVVKAVRHLRTFARHNVAARGRLALIEGSFAVSEGRLRLAQGVLRDGVASARKFGLVYDEAQLLILLGQSGALPSCEADACLRSGRELLEKLGARLQFSVGRHRKNQWILD